MSPRASAAFIHSDTAFRSKYGTLLSNCSNKSLRRISMERKVMSVACQSLIKPHVAVLYQAIAPPVINGNRKPKKPGGYRDSGADIAYALQQSGHAVVVTEDSVPDSEDQEGWCFPDTEEAILAAVSKGATHVWANTVLFGSHPLQIAPALGQLEDLKVVGQSPQLVDQHDDKDYVNSLLRSEGGFILPNSWLVDSIDDHLIVQDKLRYPIIGKPIRGRGSRGVKVCHSREELVSHLSELLDESPQVMLEEFFSDQEGTVTVMPTSMDSPDYWSLPVVVRFNHQDSIAPYNGAVAVVMKSRVPSDEELQLPVFRKVSEQCERAAKRSGALAPNRIDVRQVSQDHEAEAAIFDVDLKPNMTGPGRPGREDQASLTALAAIKLGWDYPRLLKEILRVQRIWHTFGV